MTDPKAFREAWNPALVAARRRFGPVAPPAGPAVTLAASEAFVVGAILDEAAGERVGREAIQEGLLRPADSHRADIESAHLVWVPLWRVVMHDDRVAILLARKMFPFDPSARVELPLSSLTVRSTAGALDGEVISADVTHHDAIETLRARERGSLISSRGAKREVGVRSMAVCWYPVWLRRYVYEGAAERSATGQPIECHVAVSAHTGAVVSARHPSPLGALKTRITRMFKRG